MAIDDRRSRDAFLSVSEGDGLPDQEPALPCVGTIDTNDSAGGLHSTRIRNGFVTSILGFNGFKEIAPDFKVTARVGLWMNIAGSRHQNIPGLVDPRELYGKSEGTWGSLLAGSDSDLSRGGPDAATIENARAWYDRGIASASDPNVTIGVTTPQQVVHFVNAAMTVVW